MCWIMAETLHLLADPISIHLLLLLLLLLPTKCTNAYVPKLA
jgi:hypothetical protein